MKFTLGAALAAVCVLLSCGCLGGNNPVPGQTQTFDGIEFQWCPAGTFTMGSPEFELGRETDEVQHDVTISQGFWFSKYEITQAQWQDTMGSNPSDFNDPGNEDHPVEQVTWEDVQAFVGILNASDGIYRLPTESEWEYACRAGTTTRHYWGADPSYTMIGDYAWYQGNAQGETHPVGEKMPNAWGLYDMSGNVFEWCQDWKGDYPSESVTDPQGPASGIRRVLRGGGLDADTEYFRSAARYRYEPDNTYNGIGFRLLREAE